jgi:hypothetical protein
VERSNYLGIYLRKDAATVVWLDSQGQDHNVRDCFSVSVEEQESASTAAGMSALASLIAEGCIQRIPTYRDCEVAVALDCAMFMQNKVHSEFTDMRQIAQTVRFDTEEAIATDISDVAVAFKITLSDQDGSELTVFTVQRKTLSDILLSLQSNNIDPVAIEPDVNCLLRFIQQRVVVPADQRPLFCLLSGHNGYVIIPTLSQSRGGSVVRTFLLGPTQTRGELLAREIPVTSALVGGGESIDSVMVFDSGGTIDNEELAGRLGISTDSVDLVASAVVNTDSLADCADPVDFAISYGAALACVERDKGINFRNDFMPYQGKKLRLQKALKFMSVSVGILMLAVGLYFQSRLFQQNRYCNRVRARIDNQYAAVMFGVKPEAKLNPVNKLSGELRRIKALKSGQFSVTGEESIPTKLTMVLEAFNKSAAQTNLKIDKISITTKNIRIEGSTSSLKNTLRLRKAIEQSKLNIVQTSAETKGGRNNFTVSVEPKK